MQRCTSFRWLAGGFVLLLAGNVPAQGRSIDLAARRSAHWAWQPLATTAPPGLQGSHPVDAFVDARLAAVGLQRSPPARPEVQLRRLWFDLVGLPPEPAAMARFVADPSDAAYAAQVDELLASPQFAEHQARHWLDLVRYAETLGHEMDFEIADAWRYRDYVIRAIDQDVPYDQFVREHLAGDLLDPPRRGPTGDNESVQATAAWWFAEQTHSPVDARQHESDRIDNQLDVFGKAVLGLTVACARCHDHKFDAIRTDDYYALYGFVKSSRFVQAPLQPVAVDGPAYRATAAAQQAFAAACQPVDGTPSAQPPAGPGFGPLRADEELLASAADGGFWTSNDGFGAAPWAAPFTLLADPATPTLHRFAGPFWNSAIAGRQRDGVLQTATFHLSRRYLHVRVAGQGARVNLIVDGLYIVRDPIYGGLHRRVDDPLPHWLTFDTAAFAGRPAFLQCLDQRAPDLGDPDRERSRHPDLAWLAVQCAVASAHPTPPPAVAGTATPMPPRPELTAAATALAEAQAALPVSPTIPAMGDGTGSDEPVHVRGSHRTPGPVARRRFLEALVGPEPIATGPGSGRRQLAEALLAPTNPLPARVFVNRAMHHLFGRGLVKSVDNLGALGDPPTHPELLDWLCRDVVAHGWSRRHLLRTLVTSATYRQASATVPAAAECDPENRLLHRQNVRRLDAEALRDSLLAKCGQLRPERFGPPVPIPLGVDHDARGKPKESGPLDGNGRRSIYLAIRRNFLPPMLQAFDQPTPFATVGARQVSNVPAQALTLLNDPFVLWVTTTWAERLAAAEPDPERRLPAAIAAAFDRPPRAEELALARDLLATAAAERQLPDTATAVWADLLHGLVNAADFRYRR